MRKSSPRQDHIEALLPSIRRLLATCPQYIIEPSSGPMRGIDYNRGRLAIGYFAYAERIDGRLRAVAPHSLDVKFDGETVLRLRWKDGRRRTVTYKPGRWERAVEFFARG